MDMLAFIQSRRSTRKFTSQMPTEEQLDAVLAAGRYAPSGGNCQTTHFLVIRDPEVLAHLREVVKERFALMEVRPDTYKSIANSIRASKKGTYVYDYLCPVLIVTANDRMYGNSQADCACALENMMLMANALDLGSVWINQLKWLNEDPVITSYLEGLGLCAHEKVYGALALGIPDTEDGLPVRKPLPRTGNPVTYIG